MTRRVRVSIDGRRVVVTAGANLLETAAQVTQELATLCAGRIPCLEECSGLCVVEVEGEAELKRACSHVIERPMRCETYTRRVRRERRRVLTALLSERGRKCPRCEERLHCTLPSLARDYDVNKDHPGVGRRETRGPK